MPSIQIQLRMQIRMPSIQCLTIFHQLKLHISISQMSPWYLKMGTPHLQAGPQGGHENSQCKVCAGMQEQISSSLEISQLVCLQVPTQAITHPHFFTQPRTSEYWSSLPPCNILQITRASNPLKKEIASTFNYISQPFDSTGYIHFTTSWLWTQSYGIVCVENI